MLEKFGAEDLYMFKNFKARFREYTPRAGPAVTNATLIITGSKTPTCKQSFEFLRLKKLRMLPTPLF